MFGNQLVKEGSPHSAETEERKRLDKKSYLWFWEPHGLSFDPFEHPAS